MRYAPTHQETLLLAALRCAYAAVDGLGGDGAGGGVSSRAALAVAGHASELLLGPSPASVVYENLDGAGAATLDDRELDALLGAAEREISDVADGRAASFDGVAPLLFALSCLDWRAIRATGGLLAARVVALTTALMERRPSALGRGGVQEDAAVRVLKKVAASPNIDAGGGLDVLLCALREHLDGATCDDALFRARALGRPPPAYALSFVRAATAVLCGKIPPARLLVKTAKLRVGEDVRGRSSGGSAVDHLVASLDWTPEAGDRSRFSRDVKTDGYVLKILRDVAGVSAHGKRCLLALFLEERGLARLRNVLKNCFALDGRDGERHRAHLRALELLNALCAAPGDSRDDLLSAFRDQFVRKAAADAALHVLLQRGLEDSPDDLQPHVTRETATLLATLHTTA